MVRTDTWPFHQPRNFAVLTTRQVLEGAEPILHVTHDSDDHGWQFLGNAAREEDAKIIALLRQWSSIPQFYSLPIFLRVGTRGEIQQIHLGGAKR